MWSKTLSLVGRSFEFDEAVPSLIPEMAKKRDFLAKLELKILIIKDSDFHLTKNPKMRLWILFCFFTKLNIKKKLNTKNASFESIRILMGN